MVAQTREAMPQILRSVRNLSLNYTLPYTFAGELRSYVPDSIIILDDSHGHDDPLNLIVEVTGEKKKEKEAKVAAARTLWVPAANNHDGLGRCAYG